MSARLAEELEMTNAEKEKFYDEVIAPALLELSKKCHDAGMSFIAAVELHDRFIGRTQKYVHPYSDQMDWAAAALHSGGNADTMVGHMITHAKISGHGSMFLTLLGVSATPEGQVAN